MEVPLILVVPPPIRLARVPAPGAHGTAMAPDAKTFYTTNTPGDGTDGIIAIDTETNEVVGTTDTPFPTPHNIEIVPEGDKLYLTHSGERANRVSVYTLSPDERVPVLAGDITVGINPFGLVWVP